MIDSPIHIGIGDAALSHSERVCLLYPAGARCVKSVTVAIALDGRRLDHWHTVVWVPAIVGSQALSVCYDCLCLMALFRAAMSLVHWAEWSVWTGTDAGYWRTITWEGGYLQCLCPPCDVDRLCDYRTWQIKGPVVIIMLDRHADNSPQRCDCMRGTSLGVLSAGRIPLMVIGWIDCGGSPVDCSDRTRVHSAVDFSPGGVGIGYIRGELWDRSSTDSAPVTGSLVFSALFGCLDVYCAAGFTSCRTFCSTDCVLLGGFGLSLRRVSEYWTMATEGAALVENRAGITFGVELYVPWDAPEAVVDIRSEGVVALRSIRDIIGLVGRRADAVECRILHGRYIRSVQVLVPDPWGLDQNFHDVTIVDMGDMPESSVSIPDLSLLRQQWPPAVLSHMGWLQQELEGIHAEAKQRFRQTRPSSCVYCGTWIKCDMYRNMAKFHLDLAQLWRCPVSWCTVWKGTPQDCMDHVRGGGGGSA